MTIDPISNPRVVTAEDIFNLAMASDARISPCGSKAVFVKTWLDREKNDYRSSLFLVPADGGDPVRLTSADAKDTYPRWSPDGKHIAFLSNRTERDQVYVLPVSGGEAWRLTGFQERVSAFSWSPDGASLAVVTKSESAREEAGVNDNDTKSDVVHITSIRYKENGEPGFLDGKKQHIWRVSFLAGEPREVDESNVRQLTSGDFDDTDPVWSPSGQEIYFVSDRTELRDYGRVRQIWSVPARGGTPRLVTGGENDVFVDPAPAPSGDRIAFRGHRDAEAGSSLNNRLWSCDASGGEPHCLTADLDRSTDDTITADFVAKSESRLVWSDDGQSVFTQVSVEGSTHVYRVDLNGAVTPVITGERRVLDFSHSSGRIAFTATDSLHPPEVFICNSDGSSEVRLTGLNDEFLSGVALSTPESFHVKSYNEDAREIHGWIMKPPHTREGQKHPMVLTIHGGPHGTYGNSFFHEFQTLAAAGYVVVYCNPRGSQGYGEEFCSCTRGCWGESDMPDVMAVVDHAIQSGVVDANRLGVTGGSYGGYLTNWIIGHTDRFAAAITDRCVSNMYSMYGTSDIGFTFGEYEFGGKPWEQPEVYKRYSPISYVENMTTPLLIVHSEQDYRCPIEQAEQLFISLKKLGRTVEFVRFPNENHELSRNGQPKHRVQRIEFNLDWWNRYL